MIFLLQRLTAYSNPYSGKTFWSFFAVLWGRLDAYLFGACPEKLAPDEVQCLVLIFVGLSLSFLGCFLVLKQMTMLANAISHTLLLGLVAAFLILSYGFHLDSLQSQFFSANTLLLAATSASVVTTTLTAWFMRRFSVQEDAAIGLVFTSLFALGLLLVAMFTKNLHFGVEAIMGNVDALHVDDVKRAAFFALLIIGVFLFFFRGFFVLSFDPVFMRVLGWSTSGFHMLLMLLTAMGAILAFRAVGVLLFLSLLVGPVLIARLYVQSLKKLIFLSMGISVLSSIGSVALSRHILTVSKVPVSTSGLLATWLFVLYFLALGLRLKVKESS
jgi:manganese/zinc/iron transport system permease protein